MKKFEELINMGKLDSLIWCDYQSVDTDGRVRCLAHLAENRVPLCPYLNNVDRLRSKYQCSDYRPDRKKALGL